MRRFERLTYILIFISVAMGIFFFPFLPERIASHWDMYDNPDMYISKWLGLFAIPLACSIFVILFREIPKLDPYEENVKEFQPFYDELLFVLTFFFFYIHFVMIIWNSGLRFYMLQFIAPAYGLLLFYIGNVLSKTKRNFIIGIATPWSMHDEKIWKKTHIFAGTVFKTAGILACFGFVFYQFALYFILAPLILSIIYTYIYSYTEYQAFHVHTKKRRSSE